MESKLGPGKSKIIEYYTRWSNDSERENAILSLLDGHTPYNCKLGVKLYKTYDDRWLLMDYLSLPDNVKHYIDVVEGSSCNINVRIVSNEVKEFIDNVAEELLVDE